MDEQGRTVLRRFLAGLVVVVVLFALFWLIFLRDSGKKDDGNRTSGTNSSQKNAPKDDAKTPPNTNASGGSSQVGGAQTGVNRNDPATSRLAATGPSNLATVFVITTVGAAAGHYAYTRRRLSRKY